MRIRTPLSVVVPCYNEQAVLPALHERLSTVCRGLGTDYEIVFINDGSRDATWDAMADLAARDPHLVCVNLSRNYGHQLALSAGLRECTGDAVVVLDADLQDPPELLPDMLAVMRRENADVVYGKRVSRAGESWQKRAFARLFYWGLAKLSEVPIPRDVGDFRLMSRRVVEGLTALPEHHRYIRGMVSWLGYKQVAFEYHREPRAAGLSHYNFQRMSRLALDAVTGFSVRPLTFALKAGGVCLAAAVLTLAAALWSWAGGSVPTGGLLAALFLALAGGQFLAIGIVGEYLGRMFSEVRGRPLFVIDQVLRSTHGAIHPRREAA
ncbi:glycosyltransferase family 2 protein [Limnoglobus roseus]|nr:glycosyltransferase family 2 protein [Limnoglobus roseus]